METALDNVCDSVIIRFSGELGLKKHWTRKRYERRLARNLKKTLKHYGVAYTELVRKHSRFYLKTSSAVEAAQKLARVFGISSVSPAIETSSKLDDVIDRSLFLAETVLKNEDSFAVKCKRVGKQGYSSADIRNLLGQRVLDKFGEKLGLSVDLGNPDVTLGVEVRGEQAFVYSQVIEGVGGMPLGTQAKLVGLFSGGIDSPVGLWLVMKRGSPVVPVYFDISPFADEKTTERALQVAEVLLDWAIGFPRKVYVVQHGENLKHVMETNRKYSCLLCKRMMYRVAERLAEQFGAEGIVTGEAIGEQASQTLTNLRVLDSAAKEYPVHRPLLGFDKAETEAIARKIGTYKFSSKKTGACTAVPYQPSTKAKLEDVIKAEEKLDIEAMVERSLESIKVVEI
ncbi:MAG TPA: tRNA 4-thiouridine(8) synthase ThiI [Candidatus Bathyarchaeota archaeon]|nr:tRNA 4-thiouridine(8) synthase ThiI [Candidatus Bathyarchaeota archaeon]